MKHQLKFLILAVLFIAVISVYVWDRQNVTREINQAQTKINTVEQQLRTGSGIMDEIEKIEQLFAEKKNALITYQVSGSQLAAEIKNLNDLSKKNGVKVTNIETYSEDTFPPLNDYLEGDKIPLKRHAISFQLAGNFLKIGSFMETLEKTSTDLRLEHCSFSLDDKDPRGVIAQLQYLTYAEVTP